VAPDPRKPFLVRVNDLDVKVLGTSFNINGYGDEPGVNTTLLKGGVAVSAAGAYDEWRGDGERGTVRIAGCRH
jgi:ferric-dicitrate binding protein FerR (iron transport regulator)